MKIIIQSIARNIILTFLTEMLVVLAFFLIYRLVGDRFAAVGVGEYSLVKKLAGFLVPLFFIGVGIGLPRCVAVARNSGERNAFLKSAMIIVGSSLLFSFLLFNSLPVFFAKIFFGDSIYSEFIFPFSIFLIGYSLHLLVYSYLRGRMRTKTFNMLQITNLAVMPLVILMFLRLTLENFVFIYGVSLVVSSLLFSIFFLDDFANFGNIANLKKNFKKLAEYSFPRVWADFALFGILSLGAVLMAHLSSMEEVGFFVIGQSLLISLGSLISPIGVILLPKIARLTADGAQDRIKNDVEAYMKLVLCFSLFAFFQAFIFTDWVIGFWLGSSFLGAATVARVIFFAIVPYIFYMSMRDILDALKARSINTSNLLRSLIFYIIFSAVAAFYFDQIAAVMGLAAAFSLAVGLLGIFTYRSVRQIYPQKFSTDVIFFVKLFFINIALAGTAAAIKYKFEADLISLALIEGLTAGLYCLILFKSKDPWLKQIIFRVTAFDK